MKVEAHMAPPPPHIALNFPYPTNDFLYIENIYTLMHNYDNQGHEHINIDKDPKKGHEIIHLIFL